MRKIVIALLAILLLAGCSNKAYEDVINEGKIAIASKEFEKADSLFSLAVEEKPSDKEAKALLAQTGKLIQANELKEKRELEESKKLFEEVMEIESESDVVKKESKLILGEIDQLIEEREKIKESVESKIAEAEQLMDSSDYETAKIKLTEIQQEIAGNEDLKLQLDKVQELQQKCDAEIQAIKEEEEAKRKAEEEAKRIEKEKEEARKNDPMYPMTASKALSILKNDLTDYTYIGGGEIDYEAFNEVKGTNEPAYLYQFIRNETGDLYAVWVFSDGATKLRHVPEE